MKYEWPLVRVCPCDQIDAHTHFAVVSRCAGPSPARAHAHAHAQNWDVRMLADWGATENEFAVLSTYPTKYLARAQATLAPV